jgi:hypothetical protein
VWRHGVLARAFVAAAPASAQDAFVPGAQGGAVALLVVFSTRDMDVIAAGASVPAR